MFYPVALNNYQHFSYAHKVPIAATIPNHLRKETWTLEFVLYGYHISHLCQKSSMADNISIVLY